MYLLNMLTVFRGDLRYLRRYDECPVSEEQGIYIEDGIMSFFDVDHPCPGVPVGGFDEDTIVVAGGDVVTAGGNVMVVR